MSEAKPRTSADIQQEYNNLVFKSGTLQHQAYQQIKSVEMINATLASLAVEYQKIKSAEDAAAVAQASKPAETAATEGGAA